MYLQEGTGEEYDPEWEADLELWKQAEGKVTRFAILKYGAKGAGGAWFRKAQEIVRNLEEQ